MLVYLYGLLCINGLKVLINDYSRRQNFLKNFFPEKSVYRRKIIKGTITDPDQLTNNYGPIYKSILKSYETSTYWMLYTPGYIYMNNYRYPIYQSVPYPIHYYRFKELSNYVSPNMLFNNKLLRLTANCITDYTNIFSRYLFNGNKITTYSIPNNSQVFIFGKETETNFKAEFIGTEQDVTKRVAKKYFGISTSDTLLNILMFVVYIILFTNTISTIR